MSTKVFPVSKWMKRNLFLGPQTPGSSFCCSLLDRQSSFPLRPLLFPQPPPPPVCVCVGGGCMQLFCVHSHMCKMTACMWELVFSFLM